GCLTASPLTMSCGDEEIVTRVAESLGVEHKPMRESEGSCGYVFPSGQSWGSRDALLQTAEVLAEVPELVGVLSPERGIPERYLQASVEQRWELVRGLFDTDGTIDASNGRYNISY